MIRSIINSAKEWGLTEWDWIAIVIAILSFTASIISIGIAYKTLKSQVKTQNNTRLLLSQNAGYEYLKSYISYIIISYMHLTVFDNIAKWACKNKKMICDYNPLFFSGLSLPLDGIRPDQFISYTKVYELLYSLNSSINNYNEFVDYIKRKILGNSIEVHVMLEKGSSPYTHIDEAKNYLKQILRIFIPTIKSIMSEIEKEGEELSPDDIISLQNEIDEQIQGVFRAIAPNIKKEVHSKDLDECSFDNSILDWIINDSNIKNTISSIYYQFCRASFFDKDEFFVFRKDIKPTQKEIIVDEIRTLFLKEDTENAFRKINDYYLGDINKIGRKALTFNGEDIQKGFFMKEVRRIRKFYESLYERINSRVPQSLESIDFEKWNSFNICEGGGRGHLPMSI